MIQTEKSVKVPGEAAYLKSSVPVMGAGDEQITARYISCPGSQSAVRNEFGSWGESCRITCIHNSNFFLVKVQLDTQFGIVMLG